ncbi:hypothetical protein E2562_002206 [Oryza meyeriana var. granulata]|uniref:Uncharacterized protein n=1 Tax=Oryza meyeriana var. granulata TaxID=110450 RepID=A0A6G1EF19_9ORYZ|nr:hypothetical protein E2562_002206 [Oryza meyeriana var. granulata]
MGCFLACFGDRRRWRKSRRQSPARSPPPRPDHVALPCKASTAVDVGVKEETPPPPLHEAKALLPSPPPPLLPLPAEVSEEVITGASPSKELREQKASPASSSLLPEKQVTLPLSPAAHSSVVEAVASTPDPELREVGGQESHSSGKKKVTFDVNVTSYENTTSADQEEEPPEPISMVEYEDGKHMQRDVLLPENHRYRNCSDSEEDDEYGDDSDEEEADFVDCKIDLADEDELYTEDSKQESHESLFSLQMYKDQQNDNEVSSPAPKSSGTSVEEQSPLIQRNNPRDRSQYVRAVLNPVQNMSQWKEVKAQAAPAKKLDKENVNSVPNVGASPVTSSKREVSVDASLSTWLVSSDNSTVDKAQSRSPRSISTVNRDERPVLGALTVEDLKQSSATSSPRRSPSHNREEAPILGTVGSYWSSTMQDNVYCSSRSDSGTNGIPNTTSKYREVHSTLKSYTISSDF